MLATVGRRMGRLAPVRRVLGGIDLWTVVRIGIVAGAFYAAWRAIEAYGRPYDFFDMKIYHGAVVWWAGGNDLYAYIHPDTTLGYTYPPFAGIAMLPMAPLSVKAAGIVNIVASLAALAVVLAALLAPITRRYGWSLWFVVGVATALFTATEPVRETLGYGQVNLLLFALIFADLVALRWRSRGRGNPLLSGRGQLTRFFASGAWAGAGIGLATSIKLTPALFIVYLMITRQWRVAFTAIGTAVGVTMATFAVAGRESMTYWTSVLWQTERVGEADMTPNQSLAGVLARMYDSVTAPTLLWLTFSLLLLAVGLSRASHAHADGDELTSFTLVGLTTNVISPISWSHHLLYVIPAMVILFDATLRRRDASRGPIRRPGPVTSSFAALTGLRTPVWFPALTGMRHALAAVALFLLFVRSPIWPYEHRLPQVSHYADGLWGALMENSLALAIIVLVAALPWRPGAEPVFYGPAYAVGNTVLRPRRPQEAPRRAARGPEEPRQADDALRGS
ncbi:glycosyltransferase 87 family protein [Phytohabitans sp. ZYX-F-186]|uniref:Glycosyltransferase 87 family protein n=1 Tax=Phytohabitans maris TaxID=3071409 RepID=A0ABU0ZL05_9ACTN|nr:glycosyltransferase 87 family protein [Phytohabitans sp. ZYX-F-186]MDQ7907074.1 glycosyltransferase 87 family protein [Phytohabitans sp. ZYX-F-186]